MASLIIKMLMLLHLARMSYGFLNQPRAAFRAHSSSVVWAKKKNTNDNFDMKELKQRINEVSNPYHELFAADWNLQDRPEYVHVILFKPDTDEQGVHTIEYPKGSGSNFVLAFESKDACEKFAATLESQNFLEHPSPKRYELESLEQFCDMLGVFTQVVPEGMEILPPTQNVQSMGHHNPNLKDEKHHLDYLFDMFELEVEELGLVTESGSWE